MLSSEEQLFPQTVRLFDPSEGICPRHGQRKNCGRLHAFKTPGPITKFERMEERWLQIVHRHLLYAPENLFNFH